MCSKSLTLRFILLFYFVSADYIPPQPPPSFPTTQYRWIRDDSFFDCIVGVSIDGKPVGMGVFVSPYSIIATASPFHYKSWTKYHGDIPGNTFEVFAIDRSWDNPYRLYPDLVTGDQLERNNDWVRIGSDSKHTTIYDVFVITLKLMGAAYRRPQDTRVPWAVEYKYLSHESVNGDYRLYNPYGWKFAAFAFLDLKHIKESLQLASKYYTGETPLENCDEWIPRPWGHFICLRNENNYIGIQNGAALFNGIQLIGLGAFEVNKGNESIFVFTDLLKYRNSIRVKYTTTTTTTTTTKKPKRTSKP